MAEKLDINVLTSEKTNEDRTLFMSFGLLNELCSLVGSAERVPLIDADADLAASVIAVVLIPRFPNGKPSVNSADYVEPGITMKQADEILDWVKENVLDFFCRRIEANLKLLDANKDRLKQIGLSVSGLGPAASKS